MDEDVDGISQKMATSYSEGRRNVGKGSDMKSRSVTAIAVSLGLSAILAGCSLTAASHPAPIAPVSTVTPSSDNTTPVASPPSSNATNASTDISNSDGNLNNQGSKTVTNTGAIILHMSGQVAQTSDGPEVYGVPAGEVALSFDDGPSPYTEQIISVLNQYHVKASFFFVGRNVIAYPGAVRDAVLNGELIGDHTVNHPILTNLTPLLQAQEIDNGARDILKYGDGGPITLFRPPYEAFNSSTWKILKADHMGMALWNRDPRDWAATSAQQIVNAVLGSDPSGGLYDMHDKLLTLQALPAILQGLQKMHLKVVLMPTGGAKGFGGHAVGGSQPSNNTTGNLTNNSTSLGNNTASNRSGNTIANATTGNSTAVNNTASFSTASNSVGNTTTSPNNASMTNVANSSSNETVN